MIGNKLYITATDADGAFTGRGMLSLARALEVFADFVDAQAGGRAMFMVVSNHDGRIEMRPAAGGIATSVTVSAPRRAMLGGLLPAREGVVWEPGIVSREEAQGIVSALYRLPAAEFRNTVRREMTE
jgi:hypothetical protein